MEWRSQGIRMDVLVVGVRLGFALQSDVRKGAPERQPPSDEAKEEKPKEDPFRERILELIEVQGGGKRWRGAPWPCADGPRADFAFLDPSSGFAQNPQYIP